MNALQFELRQLRLHAELVGKEATHGRGDEHAQNLAGRVSLGQVYRHAWRWATAADPCTPLYSVTHDGELEQPAREEAVLVLPPQYVVVLLVLRNGSGG